MSDQSYLQKHIERTGTKYGVCVVYPFHATYVLPQLFHVRCAEHPDFGLCAEWGEARAAAVEHDAYHQPAVSDHTEGSE